MNRVICMLHMRHCGDLVLRVLFRQGAAEADWSQEEACWVGFML